MEKNRLEAFSDGVLAIIITIMVLELKVPEDARNGFDALIPLIPKILSYLLSFIYVGIYWNNHHHLLKSCQKVNGSILWANLHLLFWLSLFPFVTAWAGENHLQAAPLALYGIVLTMAAIAWVILLNCLLKLNSDSVLARAVKGKDFKEKISPFLYIGGILIAFFTPWASISLYFIAAILWLIPDKRIERLLIEEQNKKK
ncbi:MAG TPA: TMEM175 family protein [Arachidicoccus sp.]|nr:TMEM175 family protein [Arachidicoccus sp.]